MRGPEVIVILSSIGAVTWLGLIVIRMIGTYIERKTAVAGGDVQLLRMLAQRDHEALRAPLRPAAQRPDEPAWT